MKTWIIVTIVIVLLVIAVVIYMSLKPSKEQAYQQPVVSTGGSNFYDFASGALPQLISAFKKDKPATGMGAVPPTETAWDAMATDYLNRE